MVPESGCSAAESREVPVDPPAQPPTQTQPDHEENSEADCPAHVVSTDSSPEHVLLRHPQKLHKHRKPNTESD